MDDKPWNRRPGGISIAGTIGAVGGDIVGRDKCVSGPSSEEIEAKEARDRLREIINQFDRRAIRDQMHEEHTFFMLKSLSELRVNIQKMGINTIPDPVVRALLADVRDELEEIEKLGSWISTIRPNDDWAESFLDYRIFGGREEMVGTLLDKQGGSQALQRRLSEVQEFCNQRIQGVLSGAVNIDLRKRRERSWPPAADDEPNQPAIPVNTARLAKDVFCIYIFGRIDQLKDRILAKLDKIEV